MDLIEMLSLVHDPRDKSGQRFTLPQILLMTILGVMSGNYGYRELGRFVENHSRYFIRYFELSSYGVPSFVTIRNVLQLVNFESFNSSFNLWAQNYVEITDTDIQEYKEQLGIDGKSINSTVKNSHDSFQNFVSLISVFAVKRGVVLGTYQIDNGKQSEIPAVQQLVQSLDLKGVLFSLDALHCQKKR
jgi:hypothetical protein